MSELQALTVEEPDVALGYEETLQFSQAVRRRVVRHFTAGGIPGDVKEVSVVLKALKDMDTTALDERKNNIEQGNADSARTVAEAAREFIHLQKNRNPFEKTQDDKYAGAIPVIESERLGTFDIVPGETEIGVVIESSADFMKRMDHEKED